MPAVPTKTHFAKCAHLGVALFLALVVTGCAGSSRYSADYPLSGLTIHSHDGTFSGRVPLGWFSSSDDSLAPALAAWIIKDDLTATLAVREIVPDKLTTMRIRKEGLQFLARSTLGMHGNRDAKSVVVEPATFEIAGKDFCGYEVREDSAIARVVVFEGKGRYYECEAKPSNGKWTHDDIMHLFSVQQAFLSTLHF